MTRRLVSSRLRVTLRFMSIRKRCYGVTSLQIHYWNLSNWFAWFWSWIRHSHKSRRFWDGNCWGICEWKNLLLKPYLKILSTVSLFPRFSVHIVMSHETWISAVIPISSRVYGLVGSVNCRLSSIPGHVLIVVTNMICWWSSWCWWRFALRKCSTMFNRMLSVRSAGKSSETHYLGIVVVADSGWIRKWIVRLWWISSPSSKQRRCFTEWSGSKRHWNDLVFRLCTLIFFVVNCPYSAERRRWIRVFLAKILLTNILTDE